MNLRLKILLLATIPLIAAIATISVIVSHEAAELSEQEISVFERTMLKAKQDELRHYVSMALTSIDHLYNSSLPGSPEDEAKAQKVAKKILSQLTFGPDGYFFVYDYNGISVVHPKQSWRVGNHYWDLEDKDGRKVIQNLIQKAQNGGGYYRYSWEQPSSGKVADKISYAAGLPRWQWMIGTGLYIDDVTNQVQHAKAQVNNRIRDTFLLISIITLGAVLCVFATGVAINLHETRLANGKLQALTQKIVSTQEEERGRIARELHDSISQILVSVKFMLERAKIMLGRSYEDAATAIDTAADNLNLALHEVRQISHDLRPSILDDLGLSKALGNLAEGFSQRTAISVTVDTEPVTDTLSSEAMTALYRIAQEALTNVERHSGATAAALRLEVRRNCVVLKISDNGRGFDPGVAMRFGANTDGIGMKNMHERVERFNGRLNVQSSPGGTVIEARLPRRGNTPQSNGTKVEAAA